MSSILVEPLSQKSSNLLVGENYSLTLTQSIQSLVAETRRENPNFSQFVNVFYELMQSKIDPPLESIWVYAALTVRGRDFTTDDPLNRLTVTKDLFQMISACSGSCSSSKSIAMLAPVVFELYKLVVELKTKNLSLKREKKLIREAKSLVDVILGFISVCCCKNLDGLSDLDLNLVVPLKDLFSLWLDKNESLESFLPLVSTQICREVSEGVYNVNYLAGVVIAEVFFLKLCLNFRFGIVRAELEKELKSWVVCSITAFQTAYFFEVVVRMLLEPTLPVTSLLSSEDELLLRKVMYDAVILVEHSFLNPERAVQIPAERVQSLALRRLIVTHEAIELLREAGDQKRAISYASAFSSSKLPTQIIKWIASQIRMDEDASRSFGSSAKALLKWLLSLENQGIRVFDDRILKSQAKIALENSKADYELQPCKGVKKDVDSDLHFYIDERGEVEDEDEEQKRINNSMSAAFVAAAHSMKMTESSEIKRKSKGSAGKKKKIKYLKFDLVDNNDLSKQRLSSASNEGLSSGSEVEQSISDEDVETE